jgi:hypothetical protein
MMWRDQLVARFPAIGTLGPGAYVVGGAVRDILLGRDPADVDVACADPLTMARSLGRKVIRLGDADHLNAYRVVTGEHVYDFAELLDGDIQRDLERRDFTVNAMAVDLARNELLDPHGGQSDLAARLVRMVKAANFDDDPLRMLKGVRMAVKYDFALDPQTASAIRERSPRIIEVAAERVTYELSLIFSAGALRRAFSLLQNLGLAEPLDLHVREVFADDASLAAAYAIVVDEPRTHAQRWRWSDSLLREVQLLRALVENRSRMALFDAGENVAMQVEPLLRALGQEAELDLPDFSIRPLLSGEEIAGATGLPPGPELGACKREILEKQVAGEISTREQALELASRLRRQ